MQTSYLDRGLEPTGVQMSQGWIVVPEHGRGLISNCKYDYVYDASTKIVARNSFRSPHKSTTSVDSELTHGRNNRDVGSMSV